MNIAIGSDGKSNLTDTIIEEVKKRGHEVSLYGALVSDCALWTKVAYQVAKEVASGRADQGILFCWTGTGISMAANKVSGVRAALCHDAETARGARVWNDANILAMSLRSTSEEVAKEILQTWLTTQPSDKSEDKECFRNLKELDEGKDL